MTMWIGETWICPRCEFVNAVLRRKCRNCGCPRDEQPGKLTGDTTVKIPLGDGEAAYLKEAKGPCEVHDLGEADVGPAIIELARRADSRGVDVCRDCFERAAAYGRKLRKANQ